LYPFLFAEQKKTISEKTFIGAGQYFVLTAFAGGERAVCVQLRVVERAPFFAED
jgi:hypothetical protein